MIPNLIVSIILSFKDAYKLGEKLTSNTTIEKYWQAETQLLYITVLIKIQMSWIIKI